MGSLCHKLSSNNNDDDTKITNNIAMINLSQLQVVKRKKHLGYLKISDSVFIKEYSAPPTNYYDEVKFLGDGAFARVVKVKFKKTYVERAMKVMFKETLSKLKIDFQRLIEEIEILKVMDHPNILKVYEYYNNDSTFNIITDLINGGELYGLLEKKRSFFEAEAGHIMNQLFSAMDYCYQKDIVHRDIKLENLLLEGDNNMIQPGLITVKLIDFGAARRCFKGQKLAEKIGSPSYIAPEILLSKPYDSKADMWSCGVLLYFLLCGKAPFQGDTNEEQQKAIIKNQITFPEGIWKKISSPAKDLVLHLLDKDPNKRFSARNALDHSWITSHNIYKLQKVANDEMTEIYHGLKFFAEAHKLVQAVMMYIVHHVIVSKQTKSLTSAFKTLNMKNDGRLSRNELLKGLEIIMTAPQALKETENIMKGFDPKDMNIIEYGQFICASTNRKEIFTEDNLQLAFQIFDLNKSGSISQKNLLNMLDPEEKVTDEAWAYIYCDLEFNEKKDFPYARFMKMMKSIK